MTISRWARIALLLAAPVSRVQAGPCATTPPPQGLVERCRSLTLVTVPLTVETLRLILSDWMDGCAITGRGPSLVMDNPSVDAVWDLIGGRPGALTTYVILPDYTPLTFTDEGRTCYGIDGVTFSVRGARGSVDTDQPITVTPGDQADFTSDDVTAAASDGLAALGDFPGDGDAGERWRMVSVLQAMKSQGKDFDDTYYVVAPIDLAPGLTQACYKDGLGKCLAPDDALRACSQHLAAQLVLLKRSGTSRRALAGMLLETSNAINRGLSSLERMSRADSPGALQCTDAVTALMSATGRRAGGSGLYSAWDR